jgi:serine/threonine protein kinase
MWSAGVVLYSLLQGTLPFGRELLTCARYRKFCGWLNGEKEDCNTHNSNSSSSSSSSSNHNGVAQDPPEVRIADPLAWFFAQPTSFTAKSLIVALLHCEPTSRLNATNALQHPWITGDDSHARASAAPTMVLPGTPTQCSQRGDGTHSAHSDGGNDLDVGVLSCAVNDALVLLDQQQHASEGSGGSSGGGGGVTRRQVNFRLGLPASPSSASSSAASSPDRRRVPLSSDGGVPAVTAPAPASASGAGVSTVAGAGAGAGAVAGQGASPIRSSLRIRTEKDGEAKRNRLQAQAQAQSQALALTPDGIGAGAL